LNWVDSTVLIVIALSAMMAFSRGLVRELLGIGAWVGAFFFASLTVGLVRGQVRKWIPNTDLADPAAYALMFLAGLIVLSVVTGVIGSAVRTSMLGGIDRTLGLVFGIVRAVVLVAAVYVVTGWVVSTDRWPQAVQDSLSIPYAYDTAVWITQFLPPDYRPNIPLPPLGPQTHASDLLQATPQGTATGKATARP
jgi:membrane protein required for colicin V production